MQSYIQVSFGVEMLLQFSLLSYPSLDSITESVHLEKEIYGATFSDAMVNYLFIADDQIS